MKKTLLIIVVLALTSAIWALTYTQTVTITNSASNQLVDFNYYNGGYTLQNVTVEVYFTRDGGSIGATNNHAVDTAEVTLELGAQYDLRDLGATPRLFNSGTVDVWDIASSEFFYDTLLPHESTSFDGTSHQGTISDDIGASYISGYEGSGTFQWTLEKDAINNVSSSGGSVDGQFTSLDIGGHVRVIYEDDQPLPVELSTFTATFDNQELNLRWTTQSETNNSHWNVYRSEFEDYSQSYQINGTPVQGQGTISEPTTYVYHDINSSLPETTYWYWIENVDYSGESSLHGPASVTTPQLDNPEPPQAPDVYGLMANYPNPFNPSTIIQFRLKETEPVDLTIYDIKGRHIKTLHQGIINAEVITSIIWDGTDDNAKSVSSGLYFYKLVTPTHTEAKKMLLAK